MLGVIPVTSRQIYAFVPGTLPLVSRQTTLKFIET